MRLHVVSLPHTQTTEDYLSCAYTQKIVKFAPMMMAQGYEVYIYGGEENTAPCTEFVPLISRKQSNKWFGLHEPNRFYPITWVGDEPWWTTQCRRAKTQIKKRLVGDGQDIICLVAGNCQQPIAEMKYLREHAISVEPFIGYEGIFSGYCAFESYAWRHYVYGKRGFGDGRWYDCVIPNYFNPDDFHTGRKKEYLLFLGRIVQRKGVEVASQIAERAGLPLKIAGQGAHLHNGLIESPEVTLQGDHLEYVGPVGLKDRADLLAGAVATIMPTYYIEPFGGVAIESMLSGTPVIASDWGAFTETVIPGISGERFFTLQDGVDAIDKVRLIRPAALRKWAMSRYSMDAIGPQYDRWLRQVQGLWGIGWDA